MSKPDYTLNEKDARTFYNLLGHRPQEWTELRSINPNKKKVDEQAWVNNVDDFLAFCRKWNGKSNIYAGLNPRPTETASKQNEINRVTLVPLDVDPERPKDTASTEDELQWAMGEARKLVDYLKERGFNDPYVAMSGNGIHVCLSVDLKVEKFEEIREQIKIFFTQVPVKVDQANCDLGRVFKVPGTWSIKGEHTKERPHRQSFIIKKGHMETDNKFQKWLMSLSKDGRSVSSYRIIEGKIPQGKRNTELLSFAGSMRRRGMGYDAIFAAISVENQNRCEPPLEESEVETIAKSVSQYEPAERTISELIGDVSRYFEDITKKKKVFLYDVMEQDILDEFKIVTFTDTEETWFYTRDKGHYEDIAIPMIKQFIKQKLGPYFKKSYAEELIYQIKISTYASREKMKPNDVLMNIENGILNVLTREVYPHNENLFFINKSPVVHDPSATAPTFKMLLDQIGCAKEKTLQEFCGSLLLNSPKYKKAGFIYGPTDSRKSTFTNAVRGVLGKDCVCNIPLQKLDKRFQIQRLYQMRANIWGDLGSEAFASVGTFRRTVGGDMIEAELKGFNKSLKFVWGGKHLFDANNLPDTTGDADSEAFYNRLQLFSFPFKMDEKDIDRDFGKRLATEKEKSGILNWMLDGLKRLEENKRFTHYTPIDEIRDYYKRGSNSIYCFVQDRCTFDEKHYVSRMESYRLYVQYCIEEKFSAKGRSKFYEDLWKEMPTLKIDRRKIGTETPQVWLGLKIEGSLVSGQEKLK